MVGLKGCRVIVVDDEEKDAVPILRALSKRGIAAAFFTGAFDDIPGEQEKLCGVRLVILDMDLIGGAATDKSKISALAKVLGSILHPHNGPYGIVAWTKHQELVPMLDAQILSENIPMPVFVVRMTKSDFTKKSGEYHLVRVASALKRELKLVSPLPLLGAWEQMSFEAATAVTTALCQISELKADEPSTWRTQWKAHVLRLISAMAKAESGQRAMDGLSALVAFYACLNPLHADRMEATVKSSAKPLKAIASELLQVDATTGYGAAQKAKINTMLHLAQDNLRAFDAGNVYPFPSNKRLRRKLPNIEAVAAEMVETKKTSEGKVDEVRIKEDCQDVVSSSIAVLVEVSAACDHAQANVRFARLLAGFLLPLQKLKKIKPRADFIWKEGPFFVGSGTHAAGECLLIVSARHLVTLERRSADGLMPIGRLRGQLLNALQAWLGAHGSRPGVLMLKA